VSSRPRFIGLIGICVLLVVAVGCGGASKSGEDVVRAWSEALNAGDNEAAAELFAPGAEVVQGGRTIRLETRDEATAWNSALPCSGRIVEIETNGDTVTATFLLGDRTTSPCDAPGARATAAFRIEDGKIVLWHQLSGEPEQTGPAV
jgi:ketosteroid isomerase-like protein